MKTNLFIAALSLVVLAGCSGEDEIDTLVAKSDNAINFTTYVGKQTKAGTALAGDFGVFAYKQQLIGVLIKVQQPQLHVQPKGRQRRRIHTHKILV